MPWGLFLMEDGTMQIVPLDDGTVHEPTKHCWCKPDEDDDVPRVWIHHSADGREDYEEGRRQYN